MKQHLLITKEMMATKPDSIKIIVSYPNVEVIFPALEAGDKDEFMIGDNAILDGNEKDFIDWLAPFDGVAVGNGVPQSEEFEIMHIKKGE